MPRPLHDRFAVLASRSLTCRSVAGAAFMIVQIVELLAGASNLTLLALNFRDGMAMRAKRPSRSTLPAAPGIG